MKPVMLVLFILVAINMIFAQARSPFISGEILIKVKSPETIALKYRNGKVVCDVQPLDEYFERIGVKKFDNIFSATSKLRGYYQLTVPVETDIEEICRTLRLVGTIEFATPNHYALLCSDPNDPLWAQQWQGIKQQFREAWDITRGSSTILVGVMDSGLDINHPDISPNKHPSLSWDFVDGDSDPSEEPPNNHGTRVGGVISARGNNGIGLAGYAGGWATTQGCQIVGLRVGGYDSETGLDIITERRAADAIDYARNNGIKVVNMSFAFYGLADNELSTFKAAVDAANGIVVMVAASGNGVKNDDSVNPSLSLPAPARWNGIIAVGAALYGATLPYELRWPGSNYTTVDNALSVVASVGEAGVSPYTLQTTQTGDTYSTIGRTSAAAPQVAALAALILSVNNSLTPAQVKSIIESTAEKIGSSYTYTYGRAPEVGYGRINAYKALTYTLRSYGGTISANITIPSGETWALSSGITWTFTGNYKLRVEGTLVANNVTFQGSGYPGSWFGIEFYNAPWNQSLGYCVIKDATYALNSITSHFVPYGLTVRGNTYGVNCSNYSDPAFNATVFDWNDWDVYGDNTSAPSLGMPTGYNSFRNPGYYQVYSTYSGTIFARGNWWGACPPNPLVTENVDCSEWLCSDTNPSAAPLVEDIPIISKLASNTSSASIGIEPGSSARDPGMNQVNAAYRLYLDGKYEQALQAFERNATKYAEYFSGCRALVFAERTLEKLGRSDEILARLNNIYTTYGDKLVGKTAAARRVYQDIKRGQYQDAIAQASGVVQQDADTTFVKFALYDLGSIYWYPLADRLNGAQYYNQLIARFPNDPLSHSAEVTLGLPQRQSAKPGAVAARSSSSTEFDLQNYPNPFNPSTTISYQLTAKGSVSLRIYNMLGQQVAALVDGERLPGYHQAMWDASRNPSGVYVYQLIATDEKGQKQVARKRMLLLK